MAKKNPMQDDRLIRTGWRGWLLLYGIWTIPALIMASGYYYVQCGTSKEPVLWFPILLDHLWFFYLFATMCPPVYLLTVRYPFTPSQRIKATAVQLLGALVTLQIMLVTWGVARVWMTDTKDTLLESVAMQLSNPQAIFRSFMMLVYYVVVVGAMIMIRMNRQHKQREVHTKELELKTSQLESQLTNAKLETLKMQLRPHFFFNALNTISALIESKQNDLAFKTIAQLGDLLRASLKLPDTTTVTLREELAFIDKYLTIERIRFSDRLQTRLDIEEQCLDAVVPALILQPLVENCIHHAAAVQTEPVMVSIRAWKDGSSLIMEVYDDGPGLPQDWSIETHAGVGLDNIQQRLQVIYGQPAGLQIKSDSPKGVRAQITLPNEYSHTDRR
jgi:two-component system, LytTR family, sensor kinase